MYEKCQECGRSLRSPTSMEIGYGKTCLRIKLLREQAQSEISKLEFALMEIKTLKRLKKEQDERIAQLERLVSSEGFNAKITPIEKIKQLGPAKLFDPDAKIRAMQSAKMGANQEVVKEIKEIFAQGIENYLVHIEVVGA